MTDKFFESYLGQETSLILCGTNRITKEYGTQICRHLTPAKRCDHITLVSTEIPEIREPSV